MKMVYVDTNVILRYLTNDVASLALRAKRWFQKAEEGSCKALVLHITLVEVIFLLEHWYEQDKRTSVEQLLLF
ncbi:MAG: PilT protein domain protein, partial [Microgenomates group bacterium GW2011_GWA2_47_8]